MPARVLLMARELNLGGSERQMTETARFLDRGQFEPRVGCFLPAGLRGEELQRAGVPVVRFAVHSYKSKAAFTGALELAQYIRRENIQLVHAFDYPLNVFAVPVTRWFTRAVAVASQRSHRELVPKGYRRALRGVDRIAHATVVNCEFLRQHLIKDEHVPAERVQVCYNGIDLDFFRPGDSARPAAIEDASLTIGVVCGLRREKGLPDLLRAFALVRHLSPRLRLAMVGSGPMLEELKTLARDLNVIESCVFQPGTSEIPLWLRAIDIFVLPSHSEALSNALMEAMACGCCAVASNIGGNPELVCDGQTGLLFERGSAGSLAAALKTLIEDRELRSRLATAGLAFIHEHFSAQKAAQRMGLIYSGLIARKGNAAIANAQEPQAAGDRQFGI